MGYTYGTKWNDDLIIHDIMTIVNDMNIKHFPTHTEMKKYYGDQRLIAAVSKYGGTQYWANKLGIPIKECESSFGNTYELQAIDMQIFLIRIKGSPIHYYMFQIDTVT